MKVYKIFIGKWIKSDIPTDYIRKFEFTIQGYSKQDVNRQVKEVLYRINIKSQFYYSLWTSKTKLLHDYNWNRYTWNSWVRTAEKELKTNLVKK